MRIIDAHVHLLDEPGYLDSLLATMDDCGIEKCCLSGLGPLFAQLGNQEVKKAFQNHPDRIIGTVFIRPGVDHPSAIDQAYNDGFRMIKITLPRKPYNNPDYFPLWQQAIEHKMTILFHTGIVAPSAQGRGKGVSSWNMQPMLRRRYGTLHELRDPRSLPATMIRPESATSSRFKSRMKVDFPDPDGPTRKTNSPRWISADASRRAVTSPLKTLLTDSSLIIAGTPHEQTLGRTWSGGYGSARRARYQSAAWRSRCPATRHLGTQALSPTRAHLR